MYSNINQVEAALNFVCSFMTDSVPSSTTIKEWIREESSWVDELTAYKFKEEDVTELKHFKWREKLFTKYRGISDVSVYVNTNLEGAQPAWEELDEWKHYDVEPELGRINLILKNIGRLREQRNKIKVEYMKGGAPEWVTGVVARRVALRVVEAALSGRVKEGTQTVSMGSMSVKITSDFGARAYESLRNRVNSDEERLASVSGMGGYNNA